MLFRIRLYIKFLWYSKNEHGVHSPFVFNLLTDCFYIKKTNYPFDALLQFKKSELYAKKNKLLFRMVYYFKPKSTLIQGTTIDLEKNIMAQANPKGTIASEWNSELYDCIYFKLKNNPKITKKDIEKWFLTTTNQSFWIFENIYLNTTTKMLWDYIKESKRVSVTVDTYLFGLVFFRKEQKKENFVIRV